MRDSLFTFPLLYILHSVQRTRKPQGPPPPPRHNEGDPATGVEGGVEGRIEREGVGWKGVKKKGKAHPVE